MISCGAALYNLRLAIAVAGRSPSVWLLPGPDRESGLLTTVTAERTLLASVEVMPARAAPPAGAKQELYEALTQSLELADADASGAADAASRLSVTATSRRRSRPD